MRTMRLLLAFAAVTAMSAFTLLPAQQTEKNSANSAVSKEEAQKTTLQNLEKAYNGESNAHATYLAFAKKADEEGYAKVASLFRTVAASEEVHLKNHAKVIKKMGGKAEAQIKEPVVKSTAENLQVPLKGEANERDEMYPEFIALAKKAGNRDAARSFNYAQQAEAQHFKLFKEAADNLNAWKQPTKGFYVCTVCGYTLKEKPEKRCPVCESPAKVYKLVK